MKGLDKKERVGYWLRKSNKAKIKRLAYKTRKDRLGISKKETPESSSSYLDWLIESLPE